MSEFPRLWVQRWDGSLTCAELEERGQGSSPHPLENNTAIGFLSKTGPDPLENHMDETILLITQNVCLDC